MSYPFRELGHSFPQSLYTTYSNQVRSELGGRPDLCNAFDDLLHGITSKSISTPEAMDRASWIFRKHPHLLEGFYSILPPVFDLPQEGHKDQGNIPVESNRIGHAIANEDLLLVNSLKSQLAGRPDEYLEFLKMLERQQRGQMPMNEVCIQVGKLLETANSSMGGHSRRGSADRQSFRSIPSVTGVSHLWHIANDKRHGKRILQRSPEDAAENTTFFQRVKRFFGNSFTYQSFLRLLDLYNSGYLDRDKLLENATNYLLGSDDLYQEFLGILTYDARDIERLTTQAHMLEGEPVLPDLATIVQEGLLPSPEPNSSESLERASTINPSMHSRPNSPTFEHFKKNKRIRLESSSPSNSKDDEFERISANENAKDLSRPYEQHSTKPQRTSESQHTDSMEISSEIRYSPAQNSGKDEMRTPSKVENEVLSNAECTAYDRQSQSPLSGLPPTQSIVAGLLRLPSNVEEQTIPEVSRNDSVNLQGQLNLALNDENGTDQKVEQYSNDACAVPSSASDSLPAKNNNEQRLSTASNNVNEAELLRLTNTSVDDGEQDTNLKTGYIFDEQTTTTSVDEQELPPETRELLRHLLSSEWNTPVDQGGGVPSSSRTSETSNVDDNTNPNLAEEDITSHNNGQPVIESDTRQSITNSADCSTPTLHVTSEDSITAQNSAHDNDTNEHVSVPDNGAGDGQEDEEEDYDGERENTSQSCDGESILDRMTMEDDNSSKMSGSRGSETKTYEDRRSLSDLYDNQTQYSANISRSGPDRGGPSYRRLPKTESLGECSGRDALCREVLNDEYVSHPIWASEDSGFIASAKNQSEEILHRIEEERYSHDLLIDAACTTIALLEEISNELASLPQERRAKYRASTKLASCSSLVYKRVFTKMYDNERVEEIVALLQSKPDQTVKPVLERLRAKLEEWKAEQNQKKKHWYKVESENYYKALDYRSNTVKNSDKKILSNKMLVTEIEALRQEQHDINGNRISYDPQLRYEFSDNDIHKDIFRLLASFVESKSVYGKQLREKMFSTLESVIIPSLSHGALPHDQPSAISSFESAYLFIVNDAIYCLYRLYQNLYERLHCIKILSDEYENDPLGTKDGLEAELDVDAKKVNIGSIHMDFTHGSYYDVMLGIFEEYVRSEIDPTDFMNCSRYTFGLKGYVLCSADKIVFALANQLFTVVNDKGSQKLIALHAQSNHSVLTSQMACLTPYQIKAESIVSDESNLYRICLLDKDDSRHMAIYLLGGVDDEHELLMQHKNYVKSLVEPEASSDDIKGHVRMPYLKRNLRNPSDADKRKLLAAHAGHEYKICKNTYKLFHVVNTEDVFICKR